MCDLCYNHADCKHFLDICFPLYHLGMSPEEYISGTGFLINNDGIFISAGHNFKQDVTSYKAFYNNREYQISCVHMEYDDERGLDLFVGRLDDFNEVLPCDIDLGSSDELEIGATLCFCGFNRRNRVYEELHPIDIELNNDEISFYGHVVSAILTTAESKEPLRVLIDKRLSMSFIKVLSIKPSDSYKGMSGGPVFIGNKIYGVFLADVFVTSEYVKTYIPGL